MPENQQQKAPLIVDTEEEANTWSIHPTPGICIKFRETRFEGPQCLEAPATDKFFVNLAHCIEMPPPRQWLDEETVARLMETDPSAYKIGVCVGELDAAEDHNGQPVNKVDVLVNTEFFHKCISKSEFFRKLTLAIVCDMIKAKFNIHLDLSKQVILINQKLMGELRVKSKNYENKRNAFKEEIIKIKQLCFKDEKRKARDQIIVRLNVEPVLTEILVDFVEQYEKLKGEEDCDDAFFNRIFCFLKETKHWNAKLAERAFTGLCYILSLGIKSLDKSLLALHKHLHSHAEFSGRITELAQQYMREGSEMVNQFSEEKKLVEEAGHGAESTNEAESKKNKRGDKKKKKKKQSQSHVPAGQAIANKSSIPALASKVPSTETAHTTTPPPNANGSLSTHSSPEFVSKDELKRLSQIIDEMQLKNKQESKEMEKRIKNLERENKEMEKRMTNLETICSSMQFRETVIAIVKRNDKTEINKCGKDINALYMQLCSIVHESTPMKTLRFDHSFVKYQTTIKYICENYLDNIPCDFV